MATFSLTPHLLTCIRYSSTFVKVITKGDNLSSRVVFVSCQIINRVENPQLKHDPFINCSKSL